MVSKNNGLIVERYFDLPYEKEFVLEDAIEFLESNQKKVVLICIFYVCLIFGLQKVMRDRKRFELKGLLAAWNFFLGALSFVIAFRVLPETYQLIRNFGFYGSVCRKGVDPATELWNFVFVLSKVVELCDTIFIVLRKRPLIFLHWYHHVTVLLYAWFISTELPATGRYFSCINATVHSLMYTYYGLMTLGYKKSNTLAMFLTTTQLLQMLAAIILNGCAVYYKISYGGKSCFISNWAIFYAVLMYTSYFILFAKFFRDAYLSETKIQAISKQEYKKPSVTNVNNMRVKETEKTR